MRIFVTIPAALLMRLVRLLTGLDPTIEDLECASLHDGSSWVRSTPEFLALEYRRGPHMLSAKLEFDHPHQLHCVIYTADEPTWDNFIAYLDSQSLHYLATETQEPVKEWNFPAARQGN